MPFLRQTPLSEADFPRTLAALRAGLEEGVAPGFVAGVWRSSRPGEALVAALGSRRLIPPARPAKPGQPPGPGQPMEPDTVFDLASLTKVMGTASLAATLVVRGWIDWELPLAALLPAYPHRDIRLSHLLSHTSGLPAWSPLWQRLRERFGPAPDAVARAPVADRQRAMRELVEALPPEARPGERATYSDIGFLLLGFALEDLLGMPLDRAIVKHVWAPMGTEAFFRRVDRVALATSITEEDAVHDDRDSVVIAMDRCAATENCPWRGGVLQGQVHDDNCWAMGGYAGHAGAFGRATDVLAVAAAWMTGHFPPAVRRAAWSRVASPAGCERTLGWDTPSAGAAPGTGGATGGAFGPGTVGHLGFTGTSLWIDPGAGIAVTLLSNRVHPSRENERIKVFRPRFHQALAADLAAASASGAM